MTLGDKAIAQSSQEFPIIHLQDSYPNGEASVRLLRLLDVSRRDLNEGLQGAG
jgi:hypothetical protein